MKHIKIKFALLIFATAVCVSCSDWLDVNPKSQIKSDVLFQTEAGYKRALTGVYIGMASQTLYGKNTSMYFTESLSRTWELILPTSTESSKDNVYYIGNYNYTHKNIVPMISSIWTKYYNCIAQLNNILASLETQNVKFQYDNDKLVKGEALALRAFLHFEVLKYFGPVPIADIDGTILTIPYVTEMTRDADKFNQRSYADVIAAIEKDLNEAEIQLINDPVTKFTNDQLNYAPQTTGPEDDWQYYRQNRFNYYTVLATKARLYNWIGNREKSYENAMKVISAVNTDGLKKFTLATPGTINLDLVMRSEHLFAINRPTLETESKAMFGQQTAYLTQTAKAIDEAYETTTQPNDFRRIGTRYWEVKPFGAEQVDVNIFYKYLGNTVTKSTNMVPVIRLCEMYLLAVENAPSLSEAGSL